MASRTCIRGSCNFLGRRFSRKHQLVVVPTGGGKSLAFLLPALVMMKTSTLILSPGTALLNSLVRDIEASDYSCMALETADDLPKFAADPRQFGVRSPPSLLCLTSVS